jgi:hypothetical protein
MNRLDSRDEIRRKASPAASTIIGQFRSRFKRFPRSVSTDAAVRAKSLLAARREIERSNEKAFR